MQSKSFIETLMNFYFDILEMALYQNPRKELEIHTGKLKKIDIQSPNIAYFMAQTTTVIWSTFPFGIFKTKIIE